MLDQLGWETLEQKRNYTKSMLMYKIINDHAAPNLRNHATDLISTPKTTKGISNTMELFIGIVYQMKQRMRTPCISTFKRIINSQRVEADSTSS